VRADCKPQRARWTGDVIAARYFLRRFLGERAKGLLGSTHSCVIGVEEKGYTVGGLAGDCIGWGQTYGGLPPAFACGFSTEWEIDERRCSLRGEMGTGN